MPIDILSTSTLCRYIVHRPSLHVTKIVIALFLKRNSFFFFFLISYLCNENGGQTIYLTGTPPKDGKDGCWKLGEDGTGPD